jgi:hypothetical protein
MDTESSNGNTINIKTTIMTNEVKEKMLTRIKKHLDLKQGHQRGINMVDLMMWLVIAALLLATAIQAIGYYQKAAYIYQMNAEVEVASGAVVARAAIDGTTITEEMVGLVIDQENAASAGDQITLSWGSVPAYASAVPEEGGFALMSSVESAVPSSGERIFIKAVHESVPDKDSVYFFDNTTNYHSGVNVVPKDSLLSSEAEVPVTPEEVEPGYGATDGDLTWRPVENAGAGAWYAMTSSNDGKQIAAMDRTNIFFSNDSAATWNSKVIPGKFYTLAAASEGPFIIGGTLVNNYVSMDYGTTWREQAQGFYRVVSSKTGDKLFGVLGHGSPMITSSDFGETWTTVSSLAPQKWQGLASSSDAQVILAGTNEGPLLVSRDGGASWSEGTGSGVGYWYAVAVSEDGTRLAAAKHNGHIYTSNDSGLTWTEQTSAGVKNWNSLTISSDGTRLAAATDNEYLYTSVDGGVTWDQHTQFGIGNWQATSITRDGNKVFAANYNGQMHEGTFNNR